MCDPGSDLLIVLERHVRRPAATFVTAFTAATVICIQWLAPRVTGSESDRQRE